MSCINKQNSLNFNDCSFISSSHEQEPKSEFYSKSESRSYSYVMENGKIKTEENYFTEQNNGKIIERLKRKMKNGSGKEKIEVSSDGGKTFKKISEKSLKMDQIGLQKINSKLTKTTAKSKKAVKKISKTTKKVAKK